MRDYAEIVSRLRINEKFFNERDAINIATLYREAADAIEELLARVPDTNVGKLISVEDEPPKENGRYLVRYKRDVDLGDETVHEDDLRIMRFFTGEGWRYPLICSGNVRLLNEEVTHWMPLPAPPKEVE